VQMLVVAYLYEEQQQFSFKLFTPKWI